MSDRRGKPRLRINGVEMLSPEDLEHYGRAVRFGHATMYSTRLFRLALNTINHWKRRAEEAERTLARFRRTVTRED